MVAVLLYCKRRRRITMKGEFEECHFVSRHIIDIIHFPYSSPNAPHDTTTVVMHITHLFGCWWCGDGDGKGKPSWRNLSFPAKSSRNSQTERQRLWSAGSCYYYSLHVSACGFKRIWSTKYTLSILVWLLIFQADMKNEMGWNDTEDRKRRRMCGKKVDGRVKSNSSWRNLWIRICICIFESLPIFVLTWRGNFRLMEHGTLFLIYENIEEV